MIFVTWKLEQALLYGVLLGWFFLTFTPRQMFQCAVTCAFACIIEAIISHHEDEAA